jgi:glycosyltransferase involved in cell wall biosynthesis
MKILISAWACNPVHGSEAAVGWEWVHALKSSHELWVISAAYQRRWIEQAVHKRPEDFASVRFYYPEPVLLDYSDENRFWRWQGRIPGFEPLFHFYYVRWLRQAFEVAQQLNRRVQFDLVHQLTFVGFRFAGHLWKMGLPFVWGPIGGLENTHWRLLPGMGIRGAAYYAGRNLINSWQKRFLQTPRIAFRRASGVIAATSGIQAEILRLYGVRSEVIPEVSAPSKVTTTLPLRAPGEALRVVWSGLHVSGKGLHLLLRSLHEVSGNWHLHIYGDGPYTAQWKRLASRIGIDERCTWHGRVSRQEALGGLGRAHLLVITSLKDLTSTVTVEALSQGVPIICPDHCGFSDAVTDDGGIKLSITSVVEFELSLGRAISDLLFDEEWRRRLAAGALRRARTFSSEVKAEAINRVYNSAMQYHSARAER